MNDAGQVAAVTLVIHVDNCRCRCGFFGRPALAQPQPTTCGLSGSSDMSLTIDNQLSRKIQRTIKSNHDQSAQNLEWLRAHLHPYVFLTLQEEVEALSALSVGLHSMAHNRRMVLADRDKQLIVASQYGAGSFYETLRTMPEQEISYAHFAVSDAPIPGSQHHLEIQRFEFDRKSHQEISASTEQVPVGVKRKIVAALRSDYPGFDFAGLEQLLRSLWLNNPCYVRVSPPMRAARILCFTSRPSGTAASISMSKRRLGLAESRNRGCCSPPAIRRGGIFCNRPWRSSGGWE
jgi:glutamate dehydrogenase